jgi:hypothetical protein
MDDSIVSALAIVCIFGLPIAGWIAVRAFRFMERMEMIKRGIVPPPDYNISRRAYREWVRNGGVGPMPGTAQPFTQQPYTQPQQPSQPPPFVGARPSKSSWSSCAPDDDAQQALYKGIRLAAVGLALLIGLSFLGGTFGTSDFHGGPWLLGGLIPMFVGIAQMIIALMSGAQLPGSRVNFGPPPPAPPPPQPPPPPSSGVWEQPRAVRFEELSKPVQPPDLR